LGCVMIGDNARPARQKNGDRQLLWRWQQVREKRD
jgi:hypothetical protein